MTKCRAYWANAIVIDTAFRDGKICRRFTCGSNHSLKEAQERIDAWVNDKYTIPLVSWIVHGWDKRVVCFKEYHDNVQSLEWGGASVVGIPDKLRRAER